MEPTPGQEPSQITVTVYSARNLPSRRKGEVCHASVVFGVGKDCYMTETIESNNPEWNQEAHIAILGRLTTPMKFKVRDKEHTLGVLQMTLSELTSHKGQKWYPLQPHRKSHDKRLHENQGELLVGCWVSEYKMVSPEKPSPSTSRTSSNEDLRKKEHRKERFSFHGRTPSGGRVKHLPHEVSPTCTEKPLASSDYEIHSKRVLPSFQSDTNLRFASFGLHDDQSEMKQVTPEQSPLDSSSLQGETENFLEPEVTGISPNECPVEGNQRVILRGSNLGESRSDVVRVVVADVDCTSTLEYFSPAKLVVTTSSRHSPGSGPVLVETVRGGVGVSSITFTFVAMEAVSGVVGVLESHSPFIKKRKQQHQEVELELQTELKGLRQQLRDLKDENVQLRDENQSLKNYIDRLLLGIISTSPEILEVKGESTTRRSRSLLGPLSTDY